MRSCGKLLYRQRGHRRRYNTAHALFTLDNEGWRHTEYLILLAFPWQQRLRNAPRCCVISIHPSAVSPNTNTVTYPVTLVPTHVTAQLADSGVPEWNGDCPLLQAELCHSSPTKGCGAPTVHTSSSSHTRSCPVSHLKAFPFALSHVAAASRPLRTAR
jgi:hypothetical protein